MTSLVCWAGVDSRGPTSLYIATDSRISWGQGTTWDAGRKVFAGRRYPEIFGYVGDVLFPSLVLGQITEAIDTPLPVSDSLSEERFKAISCTVKSAFASLPATQRRPFKIAHAIRLGTGMQATFRFQSLAWNNDTGWTSELKQIPTVSDSLAIWGSGSSAIELWKKRWDSSSQRSTSRAVFGSFCDAIANSGDPLSGGAPQLVGLYRAGLAQTIGVFHQGRPYIFGLPADPVELANVKTECRNHLFERCDWSGKLLDDAQHHHAPKGLGGSTATRGRGRRADRPDLRSQTVFSSD